MKRILPRNFSELEVGSKIAVVPRKFFPPDYFLVEEGDTIEEIEKEVDGDNKIDSFIEIVE